MRVVNKVRNWFRLLRRSWAARKGRLSPLREFVYLDEVSVYSLIASRLGPVAAEFTKKETISLSRELTGELEADATLAKGKAGVKYGRSNSTESQVLRKATVQTTFKELYEYEKRNLAIRVHESTLPAPTIDPSVDLSRAASQSAFEGWIIDTSRVERGKMFELRVRLHADPAFRATSVIGDLSDIIQENAAVFPTVERGTLSQVAAVNKVMQRFMVGLIPLRCESLDYEVVTVRNKDLLVHRELLHQLGPGETATRKKFYITGVTEERLYWKDIRRVLFAQSEFTMLCRADSNLVRSWTAVKLVDSLREVFPDIATFFDGFGSNALRMMGSSARANSDGARRVLEQRTAALVSYGTAIIALSSEQPVSGPETDELLRIAFRNSSRFSDITEMREAFQEIQQYVESLRTITVDPEHLPELRGNALAQNGLSAIGQPLSLPPDPSAESGQDAESSHEDVRIIESEIVAIFW